MSDLFWDHWGRAFTEMISKGQTKVTSIQFDPGFDSPHPSAAGGLAPRIESLLMDPLKLRFQKLRIVAPRINVQTTRFSEPQTTLLEERMHASASKNPQIHKKLPKVLPPPGIPIKDRLLSVLQPPISVLFGDNRLWLPFEPFPYQYEGIHFLVSRWSALLADEMGLGKTMQTILSLRLLLRAGIARTGLLVCPKPLVTNWMREFALWAEEIPVMVVQGDTWQRRNCWIHDRCPIKVANYESISRDEELFRSGVVSFDVVVLDEAQRIKNRDSKTASVVHSIRRKRSWALTGTPVENRAQDLFSILEFVHGRPTVDEDRTDLLRDAVSEVLLRRTKDMVMDDLPQKLIKDAYVDLGPAQRASYDAAEKEGIFRLNDLGEEVTIEHVFELIRVLKQICNFDPVTGESAKAERVKADLEEIASSGQKAILFSQWVETLEKLADKLTDFAPMLYHGKISGRQREQILREFREDRHRPLLMLSYGTGAVGLNLQYTNYVFLFDRWWNPAVEDQAINRAHRIGQKDRVFVSRMITPGTIEERVAEVLEKKRELFSFLIDDHDPLTSTGLSREDVFGLFDLQVGRREKRAA